MNGKNSWSIYRTRFLVRACQLTESLTFTDALGREHSGQRGDYLVETPGGIRRITNEALFEDIYVRLASAELSPRASEVRPSPTPAVLARPATCVSHEDRLRASA